MNIPLCSANSYLLEGREDEALSGELPLDLKLHWQECTFCQAGVERHKHYLKVMAQQQAPELAAEKKAALLNMVAEKPHFQWQAFAYGNLAAAAVLGAVFFAFENRLLPDSPEISPSLANTEVISDWHSVHTVPVVIIAPADMRAAELAITLPEGYALDGLEGLTRLQWQLDLKAGQNVIQLPISFPSPETLGQPFDVIAEISYQAQLKTFTMTLNQPNELQNPKDAQRKENLIRPQNAGMQNVKPV